MNCYLTVFLASILFVAMSGSDVFAQRAGQSVTVRTGTVAAMRSVDLNDVNAIGGAKGVHSGRCIDLRQRVAA